MTDLDHIAHFLPDLDAARQRLIQIGFTLTPFSAQWHRLAADQPLIPAGTGNQCIMLNRGYLEFLTPTHDTAHAEQLRVSIGRYTGIHLVALGTQNPQEDFDRLDREGFNPLPAVHLQRQIHTLEKEETARFTVVRVAPTTMSEGRIQFCQQHTPEFLWQPRWLEHPNGAEALSAVIFCVKDPLEAAKRYSRYTGRTTQAALGGFELTTDHGDLIFWDEKSLYKNWGITAPTLPWIAGFAIKTNNLQKTQEWVKAKPLGPTLLTALDPCLGSHVLFHASGTSMKDWL